jgi:hypothetical protein
LDATNGLYIAFKNFKRCSVLSCIGVSCLYAFLKNSLRRSWKLWGLAAVVLVALASSGYAYWRSNASPSSSLYVTATKPPIELRMELDKTEFQLNETVAIHLLLKNIGDGTIKIFFPYMNGGLGYVVKDANGVEIFNFPLGGLCAIEEVTLDPGRQVTKALDWSQIGRPSNGDFGATYSVPSGTYYIIGRTELYLIDSLEAEQWTPWIATPSITITIG